MAFMTLTLVPLWQALNGRVRNHPRPLLGRRHLQDQRLLHQGPRRRLQGRRRHLQGRELHLQGRELLLQGRRLLLQDRDRLQPLLRLQKSTFVIQLVPAPSMNLSWMTLVTHVLIVLARFVPKDLGKRNFRSFVSTHLGSETAMSWIVRGNATDRVKKIVAFLEPNVQSVVEGRKRATRSSFRFLTKLVHLMVPTSFATLALIWRTEQRLDRWNWSAPVSMTERTNSSKLENRTEVLDNNSHFMRCIFNSSAATTHS